jgi:hypothetical protein
LPFRYQFEALEFADDARGGGSGFFAVGINKELGARRWFVRVIHQVKFLTSPPMAFLYKPFTSRAIQVSKEALT